MIEKKVSIKSPQIKAVEEIPFPENKKSANLIRKKKNNEKKMK